MYELVDDISGAMGLQHTTTPSLEVHLPGLRKPSAPFYEYNFSKTSLSLHLQKKHKHAKEDLGNL